MNVWKWQSVPENQRPEGALLFILAVGVSAAVTQFLPAAYFQYWRDAYLHVVASSGTLLGLDVAVQSDILAVGGFQMRMIDECTAINYMHILVMAMLFYTPHTISYRALGIAIAVPLIFAANCFRLLVTGISGSISRTLFELVHEYLWVALFAFFVLAIWKSWADGSFRKILFHSLSRPLMICSMVWAVLLALLPVYGSVLATLASPVLKMFLSDTAATVDWMEGRFLATCRENVYTLPLRVEYFNVSVLAGLIWPRSHLRKKNSWSLVLFALLAAVLLNAIFIGNIFSLMIVRHQSIELFLTVEKAMLLALPFALWWVVAPWKSELEGKAEAGLQK